MSFFQRKKAIKFDKIKPTLHNAQESGLKMCKILYFSDSSIKQATKICGKLNLTHDLR